MGSIKIEVVRDETKRFQNRTWRVYADGKFIGIVEEIRETGDVIGIYLTDNGRRAERTENFGGKTIGERTSRAAGYILAKVENQDWFKLPAE